MKPPDYMHAFDGGDWSWYVHGHDREECWMLDDPELLRTEALFMRPIRASQAGDYGFYADDGETVTRNPETGRFEPVWCWIECGAEHRDAEPFLGVSYKPDALSTQAAGALSAGGEGQ